MSSERIGVIGGGVIGLATARALQRARPDANVTVLEKEPAVARHQTGRNSGVVHAGLYYQPGSLKAKLCRRGVNLMKEFADEHGLPFVECGKSVVALTEEEVGRLRDIERRALANGVPGLSWLDSSGLREREPNVVGLAALHSAATAIVDYRAVARALADEVVANDGLIQLGRRVTAIQIDRSDARVRAGDEEWSFQRLVICGGLQTDRLARLAGDQLGPDILPFRGEYFALAPEREHLVNGLVYPVPDPAYPFLGVHFTRRVGGAVDVGPNAVLALAREGYRRRDVNLKDVREMLTRPGPRHLARRHWRAGIRELLGSASKRVFTARARKYIPNLSVSDLVRASNPSGVRAQAIDDDGTLVDDFRISQIGPVTAVRNAPSPGATSSLAIAEYITSLVPEA